MNELNYSLLACGFCPLIQLHSFRIRQTKYIMLDVMLSCKFVLRSNPIIIFALQIEPFSFN
jgi:hypothetical protein